MYLSEARIREFQKLYFDHFGKEISKEAAYESAVKLIELVEIVSQPLSEEDLLMVQESRKEIKSRLEGIK